MGGIHLVLLFLTFVGLQLFAAAKPTTQADRVIYDLKDAPALFAKFVKDYKKTYQDREEYRKRLGLFTKTLKLINYLNSTPDWKPGDAVFDINKFADYTKEEKKNILLPDLPNNSVG